MATRDRTRLFRQLRSISEHPQPSNNVPMTSFGEDPETGLLGGELHTGVGVPPVWVQHVEQITNTIAQINKKMGALQKMHSLHLARPGISANEEEEHAIEALTAEITTAFSRCKDLVMTIETTAKVGKTNEESKIKKNLTHNYALQLRDLSEKFRKIQEKYMGRLRQREDQANVFESELGGAAGASAVGWVDPGFNESQQNMLAQSDAIIQDRSLEIQHLHSSMVELAQMFKDMSLLVIEQGSLLDQIDQNVESVVAHIEKAAIETDTANKYHAAYQKKLCILLLIVVCLGLMIVLFVRHSSN